MNDIVKNKCGINFMISPQIELLSVIQIMTNELDGKYKEFYTNNEYYVSKVKNYFKDYINHPAITNYRNFYVYNSQIINYSFLNDKLVLDNSNIEDKYKEYIDQLNDFITKSNFNIFFNDMKDYYNGVLDYNLNNINNLHISDNLSDFYNTKININVILKIIQSDWGEYLSNIDNTFTILCGTNSNDKYPLFINPIQLSSLCFHECTHPFVNKYITSDYDLLAKSEKIYLDLDENSIARKEYYTYNSYLEDLIVRAITAYMHYKYGYKNKDEYKDELLAMKKMGFDCIEDIANIIETNNFYTSVDLIKKYLLNKSLISFKPR